MSGHDTSAGTQGDNGSQAGLDRLLTLPQYLVPQRGYSALVRWLSHCPQPWLRDRLIQGFIRLMEIDLDEAEPGDPAAYADFNAFFTRALKAGARPLAGNDALLCPVDGSVSQLGAIHAGTLLQAKGHRYRLEALLADAGAVQDFADGRFITLYLSPRDYHRVHMPLAGWLRWMRYVPGRLFSVNARTTRTIPGLFARNERLVMRFETALGPLALVMVGAIGVGGLETVWAGPLSPPHSDEPRRWDYPATGDGAVQLAAGAELGRFNLGSTVIVLLPEGAIAWSKELAPGTPVRMGQSLGNAVP